MMKEDYPLAFVPTQAVSLMSCVVRCVFTRRQKFRARGQQVCKRSIQNLLQRFKGKCRYVVSWRRTRLRWPTVPILVFLAGVLLASVSAHAQTVVEVEGNVKQNENQSTLSIYKEQAVPQSMAGSST